MATLRREGDELVVKLTALEKLGALHDDVRVPWASVRYVRLNELAVPRAAGPPRRHRGCPGWSRSGRGTRAAAGLFAAIYRGRRRASWSSSTVRAYRKLVVTMPDAAEVAASLSRDLGL